MTAAKHPLVLGVDAGNSKTVAVVADTTGAVRGYGRAGIGDIYGTPTEEEAVAEVLAAVSTALQAACDATAWSGLAHAAFCLAGIDWDSDVIFWRRVLTEQFGGLSHSLHNDGFALLRSGSPDGIGVAVSAGTGGAVVARGPRGEWSASFWIVDPVGGGSLGERAFAAVVRAELGIGERTKLSDLLLDRHGYSDVASMLEDATRRGGKRLAHAALARDVLDAARDGDHVAGVIVTDQSRALAAYATAAAERVGLSGTHFPVILGGSVLSSTNPALRDATTSAIATRLPGTTIRLTPTSPVVGAVGEAIAEHTGWLSADVMEQLGRYRFPDDFLTT